MRVNRIIAVVCLLALWLVCDAQRGDDGLARYLASHYKDDGKTGIDNMYVRTYEICIDGLTIDDWSSIKIFLSVRFIYLKSCKVTSFKHMPSSVMGIYCRQSSLMADDNFPARLKYLTIDGGEFSTVRSLPKYLETFCIEHTGIRTLPPLPDKLKTLICNNNKIDSLPDLPSNLESLSCKGNRMRALPDLPQDIEYIDCSNNLIASLPSLPEKLKFLKMQDNKITRLPTLPDNMIFLNSRNNNISNYRGFKKNDRHLMLPFEGYVLNDKISDPFNCPRDIAGLSKAIFTSLEQCDYDLFTRFAIDSSFFDDFKAHFSGGEKFIHNEFDDLIDYNITDPVNEYFFYRLAHDIITGNVELTRVEISDSSILNGQMIYTASFYIRNLFQFQESKYFKVDLVKNKGTYVIFKLNTICINDIQPCADLNTIDSLPGNMPKDFDFVVKSGTYLFSYRRSYHFLHKRHVKDHDSLMHVALSSRDMKYVYNMLVKMRFNSLPEQISSGGNDAQDIISIYTNNSCKTVQASCSSPDCNDSDYVHFRTLLDYVKQRLDKKTHHNVFIKEPEILTL